MPYEVNLGVFHGPIDLLLHLITRQRVDIYEVSLSAITEEYLTTIARIDQRDLETATGFLVVAATLLELKSARLLPDRGSGGGDTQLLEERDLLLARLGECATYREVGDWFRAEMAAGEGFFGRAGVVEPEFVDLVPDVVAGLRADDLARVAAGILSPGPRVELDTSHVAPITASVRDAVVELSAALEGARPTTFRRLCGPEQERIRVVVRFLALLELFKAGAVEIEQFNPRDDIVVRWTGAASAAEVLEGADEYAASPEESRKAAQ
jgi:segregation and condensation protein A